MTVSIRGSGSASLVVTVPYHPVLVAAVRSVPDRKWNPTQKAWLLPDTAAHGEALLQALWQCKLFAHPRASNIQTSGRSGGIHTSTRPLADKAELHARIHDRIVALHYSRRTEQAYKNWIDRFLQYFRQQNPETLAEEEINQFLTGLAVRPNVSASTQNQALAALLFFCRQVTGKEIGELGCYRPDSFSAPCHG